MSRSIVEYFASDPDNKTGQKCGYCKQEKTRYTNGMWGHVLTAKDYQDLIDRGWRRAGQYCYKPINSKCCCPMYTIRCQALNLNLSKSQKKVLRKFKNYIENGEKSNDVDKSNVNLNNKTDKNIPDTETNINTENMALAESKLLLNSIPTDLSPQATPTNPCSRNSTKNNQTEEDEESFEALRPKNKICKLSDKEASPQGGQGKAKEMRRERWRQKQLAKGLPGKLVTNRGPQAKGLEEWLGYETDSTHKFKIRIVLADVKDPVFQETFEESLAVYQKYQMAVHGDLLDKCDARQYTRFLCTSPLAQDGIYGAYHRQYLLNGKIIAVGVIDILPSCLSSVYLYYDPDFSFLSLGTYTSLSEIGYVRSLQKRFSDLQYYYLGFYIHSCQKMRYKGEFSPSLLCCPESYTWHPIDSCRPLLDASTYARLCPNLDTKDSNLFKSIYDVMVLHRRKMMNWSKYIELTNTDEYNEDDSDGQLPADEREQEIREVTEYGQLVGRHTAANILLYRPTKDN